MRRRPLLTLLALAALAVLVVPAARADGVAQPPPFAQDWSNTGLITANDIWSGVPGIEGYRGDGLTTANDVDPQTVLAADDPGVLDVNANQTSPNTFTTGGVAEFELPNPVVALTGSGTADAPYLRLSLDTTGTADVTVSYVLRDLDGSADNAVQQVALQYRVGASGSFANLPAGYVADATEGPSLATKVTPVSVTLPAAANGQPLVQVRIMTTNATGSDEWVGVDDISVTAGGPALVSVTAPDASAAEAGSDPGTFRISRTGSTGAPLTVSYAVGGTAAASDYSPALGGTAEIPAGASSVDLTVTPVDDADVEGDETVQLTLVDGDAYDLGSPASAGVTIADDDLPPCPRPDPGVLPISQVQGSGAASPVAGSTRTVEGVVTAVFPGLAGFFLEEEAADRDGNGATSEGLFVFMGSAANIPAFLGVGDTVRVTGRVAERVTSSGGVTSSQTQIANSPLPAVVDCGVAASVAPTDVTFPLTSVSDLEPVEAMLVRLPQTLQISEYFDFDRFGEIVLALPLPGEPRVMTPTSVEEPGAAALARAQANILRRITVDDGRDVQNPDPAIHPGNGLVFTLANRFRGGDTVAGTVGPVLHTFGRYRVTPTAYGSYAAANARPAQPDPVGGRVQVAAFNTLNFFLTLDGPDVCGPTQDQDCRGADSDQPLEFDRQRAKLLAALAGLDADVVGLIELENTPGVDPLGDPGRGIVAGLDAALGPGTYAAIDTGLIGRDTIRVGLIYKPGVVTPVGPFRLLTSAVDPRFDDTLNRPALAQTFEENATRTRFTVVVNHLKSKGSDCNAVGDPDLGDGQGNCNRTRTAAAQALVDWLATDPTGSGDADALIVGDLNAYTKEDPIDAVLAAGYTNLIAQYQGTFAYSFVFDGQAGYLDHALASPSFAGQVTGATEWHVNADEPDLLDYDTSFKQAAQDALYEPNAFRSSDHDPVLVGISPTYEFSGFFAPLANPPAVNEVSAGSSRPVRFSLAGFRGLGVLAPGSPTSQQANCTSGAPLGPPTPTSSPGGSGLTYDPATDEYTYPWKTEKAWAGTCRRLDVTLADGTTHSALFRFK